MLDRINLLLTAGSAKKAIDVDRWRSSQLYSPRERAALDYAEAMTLASQRTTDAQLQALRAHFDDDGIVLLTAWIAFQNMSAKFNTALGAEDNGLCQRPPTWD